MDKIVVANLFRLGKDGDKFSMKFKTGVRSKAKVGVDYVKTFNANWKTSGMVYEIDEKATKERDESVLKANNPIAKLTRDELKEKADEMGIEYPKNIKTEKLIELISK